MRSIAYFVNWGIYGRAFFPPAIPVDSLSHVLYAFANVQATGEVILSDLWSDQDIHYEGDSWNDVGTNLYGNFKQLYLLKKQNRNLKLLLSIGGWTYSANFASPASTVQGRATFVNSSITLLENYGLDGLDIDWEFPATYQQGQDYLALLKALREGLDRHAQQKGLSPDRGYELSVAAPCGAQHYAHLPIADMDRILSFWNLMAYDFAGSWSKHTDHQANLFSNGASNMSIETAVNHYRAQGVASDKLVIGMPLYGRSFMASQGVGTPFQGVGAGSWEAGTYDYKSLPLPGSVQGHDSDLVASWCHNPATGEWVSFDTVESATAKAQWIRDQGLGGVMYWEMSGDHPATSDRAIIPAVARVLGSLDSGVNHLDYPGSKFDNLRRGVDSAFLSQ